MTDLVNHPPHYVVAGLPECVDVIEGLELPWHLGNAMKYLWRAGRKTENPAEDLRKCIWYLQRYLDQEIK